MPPAPKPALAAAGAPAAVAAAGGAAKKAEAPAPAEPKGVTRREFLNYVWGASMALFLAQFAGISFFFAFPRFRRGEQGGVFEKTPIDFPAVGERPNSENVGKFWMIQTPEGAFVHYRICTHLGCIFAYDDAGQRFACPCHGSQFERNGAWIAGPAPRGLDRFPVKVVDANNNVIVDAPTGGPFEIPSNAAKILVDTGRRVTGTSHF